MFLNVACFLFYIISLILYNRANTLHRVLIVYRLSPFKLLAVLYNGSVSVSMNEFESPASIVLPISG